MCFRRDLPLLLLLVFSLVNAGPTPTNKPAAYPAWWFEQDVIPRTSPTIVSPRWPNDYPAADDFAVANIGQLKHMAIKARNEFVTRFGEAGPGLAITTLVDGWSRPVAASEPARDDFAAVNQGQAKAVSALFYDRLYDFVYGGPPLAGGHKYPWDASATAADAYAVANLGQLKWLFSFDPRLVPTDSDGDGMGNIWEVINGLDPRNPADAELDGDGDGLSNAQEFNLHTTPFAADTDGDGMPEKWEVDHGFDPRAPADALADANLNGVSNLDEYLNGNDPRLAAYGGLKPTIQIISGNNQTPLPGRFMTQPMRVRALRPNGTPWPGIPVHFHADPGEGLLAASNTSDAKLLLVLTVQTDANGYAQAWLKCP